MIGYKTHDRVVGKESTTPLLTAACTQPETSVPLVVIRTACTPRAAYTKIRKSGVGRGAEKNGIQVFVFVYFSHESE
jgi:hypothetical protein